MGDVGATRVTLDEVTRWRMSPLGLGHVVISPESHYVELACGRWSVGEPITERPRRICPECRAALRGLRRVQSHVQEATDA